MDANKQLIAALLPLAKEAGCKILDIYEKNFSIEHKTDNSPLTEADRASNEVIIAGLQQLTPNIPIISEESKLIPYATRQHWTRCWIVDPLDGTKEFIKRNGEFTVNIALIEHGQPILGVVYVPVSDTYYYAIAGQGSYKQIQDQSPQRLKSACIDPRQIVRVVASRSHLSSETTAYIDTLQQQYAQVALVSAGSSLKFCLLAEGKAHIYPRFAPTMEWDTAAGHLVAAEAGAEISVYPTNEVLYYNRENLVNPHFLVICKSIT